MGGIWLGRDRNIRWEETVAQFCRDSIQSEKIETGSPFRSEVEVRTRDWLLCFFFLSVLMADSLLQVFILRTS